MVKKNEDFEEASKPLVEVRVSSPLTNKPRPALAKAADRIVMGWVGLIAGGVLLFAGGVAVDIARLFITPATLAKIFKVLGGALALTFASYPLGWAMEKGGITKEAMVKWGKENLRFK